MSGHLKMPLPEYFSGGLCLPEPPKDPDPLYPSRWTYEVSSSNQVQNVLHGSNYVQMLLPEYFSGGLYLPEAPIDPHPRYPSRWIYKVTSSNQLQNV